MDLGINFTLQCFIMFPRHGDSVLQLNNCYYFLAIWMSAFPNRGIYHFGIVFCRFTYVRYATGTLTQLRVHFLTRKTEAYFIIGSNCFFYLLRIPSFIVLRKGQFRASLKQILVKHHRR